MTMVETQPIAVLKTALDWLKDPVVQTIPGITISIHDPDGWRHDDGVDLQTPVSLEDFQKRLGECTQMYRENRPEPDGE